MKEKEYLKILLIATVLLVCNTCQFFEKDEEDEELVELPTVEIFDNPTDPTLMKITDLDGSTLTYFGEKDAEGLMKSIKQLIIDFADVEGITHLVYDSIMRPAKVETSNGTLYEFGWITEAKMRIKIISPNGQEQINIPYDLDSSYKSLLVEKDNLKPENIRKQVKPNANIRSMPASISKSPGYLKSIKAVQTIQVMRCGEPVDNAVVRIGIMPAIGSFSLSPLEYTGEDGVYQVQIPHSFEKPTNLDIECNLLISDITSQCEAAFMHKFKNQFMICFLLQEMYDDDPQAMNDEQKKIIQSCHELARAIKVTCEIINDNHELKVNFCKEFLMSSNEPEETVNYSYTLFINIPGEEEFQTAFTQFDPNTPNSWTYDVGGETSAEKLYTVPVDPNPHQGYTAYAYVVCPEEAGTDVTISVQGSDGYTNSATFTLTENSEISLWVPGAIQNTVDKVTIATSAREWTITIIF